MAVDGEHDYASSPFDGSVAPGHDQHIAFPVEAQEKLSATAGSSLVEAIEVEAFLASRDAAWTRSCSLAEGQRDLASAEEDEGHTAAQ